MICRFCSQWNRDTAARCTFCNNHRDAEDDATCGDLLPPAPTKPTPAPAQHLTPPGQGTSILPESFEGRAVLVFIVGAVLLLILYNL